MRFFDKDYVYDDYGGITLRPDHPNRTTTTTRAEDGANPTDPVQPEETAANVAPTKEQSESAKPKSASDADADDSGAEGSKPAASADAAVAAAAKPKPKPIPMPDGPFLPSDRADMLKRNLVIRRRRDKGLADDHEELPQEQKKSKTKRVSEFYDKYIDTGIGIVQDGEKLVKDVSDLKGGDMQKTDDIFGMVSMGTSALSMVNSIYKTRNNVKRAKNAKNAHKRHQAELSVAGGAAGLLANALSITSKGMKYWGDGSKNQKDTIQALGMMSSLLGVVGSAAGMLSARSARNEHRQIARDTGKWSQEAREADKFKPNYAANLSRDIKDDSKKANRDALKQERTDYKAKKYAMGMAHDFNDMKGSQTLRGGFGMAKSLLGFVTSATKAATGSTGIWNTTGGKAASLVLDGVSTLMKYAGKVHDKALETSSAMESNDKKLKSIDDYIRDKMANLQVSTDEMFKDVPQDARDSLGNTELSMKEKKRVIIARLGLDIKITDEELSDEEKLNAFKLLAIRRARNIMNASGATKKQMLRALGLDESAGESDIVKAMTGE